MGKRHGVSYQKRVVDAISERTFYNMLKASADPKNDLPDDTVQLKFNFDWE